MARYTPNTYTAVAGRTDYVFSFETQVESDVHVLVDDLLVTAFTIDSYTTAGGTVVFDAAPSEGATVVIFRATDLDAMNVTFQSGSAIRGQDLNSDFTQLRNAIQENNNLIVGNDGDLAGLEIRVATNENNIAVNTQNIYNNAQNIVSNAESIAVNRADIATNAAAIAVNAGNIADNAAAIAQRWNKTDETIASNETWVSDNNHVATTAAITARIASDITAANPTQTYTAASTTGTLTLQPGGDTTTLPAATTSAAGLLTAADKQKLDRIEFNTRRNTTFTTSFDGTSTDYTLTHKTPNSAFEILLTVGGIIQQPNVDFTYNSGTGVVSFAAPPPKTSPYAITFNSVLTSDVGQATVFDNFLTEDQIQDKLDLLDTAVDAKFDQLRAAISEAVDFDTLKVRLLAVLN